MLRNILFISLGLFIILLWGYFFLFSSNNTALFPYPSNDIINFADEPVDISPQKYYNKERFDKEFLITGNNLYQFYLYVKRYPLYIPYVEEKLKENDIPDDFKYLPIAESALRDDVVSHAGAAGIWQFIPETARRYGLQVDEDIDERYNFEKATEAAIEYFKDLYAIFWNWTLVAAAYNRWENGLQRDMGSQKIDNYYDLYLNDETSRYVFRILAIKYLMQSYFEKKTVIDKLIWWVYALPETQTLSVNKIEDLFQWSRENGYNYRDIRMMNPWILGSMLPEGNWEIKVVSLEE